MARAKTKPPVDRSKELYPLHRGPFLFSPRFLTASDWFQNFSDLIGKVLLEVGVNANLVRGPGDRCAIIKFTNFDMTVDGDGGLFFLDDFGFSDRVLLPEDDNFLDGWSGPCGAPDQFFQELGDHSHILQLGADYKGIRRFSSRLYLLMEQRFKNALKSGEALVSACIGSPLAERSDIEAWKLHYLKLVEKERELFFFDDRNLDQAVSDDGIKIFGLAITPLVTSSAVARTAVTTAKGKRGHPVVIDHNRLNEVILDLLRTRGIPGPKRPNWTGRIFIEHVRKTMKVSGTVIRENLRLLIDNNKKQLQHSGFRQCANSKTSVN